MSDEPIRFTTAQNRALVLERNLSVVAGAGTGKTQVLTERYLRILERARDPHLHPGEIAARPDQIVAVTYTRKAAEEMRQRIRSKLTERIDAAREARDEDALRHWTRMRRHLVDAQITTIHGLAANILREHGVIAGFDPDFGILEGSDETLLIGEAVGHVIRRPPVDARDALGHLMRLYTARSVHDTLAGLLGSRGHADVWAADVLDKEPDQVFDQLAPGLLPFGADEADALLAEVDRYLEPLRGAARPAERADKRDRFLLLVHRHFTEPRVTLLDKARLIWAAFDHFTTGKMEPYKHNGAGHAIGSRPDWADHGGRDAADAAFTGLIQTIEPLVGRWDGVPTDADRTMLRVMRGVAAAYVEARERYDAEKKRRDVLDFQDLEAYALQAIGRPGVADALRQRFRHLLVDEFQDTNATQWALIRALGADRLRSDGAAPGPDSDDDEDGFQAAAAHFGIEPDADPLESLGIERVGAGRGDETGTLSEVPEPSADMATDGLGRDRLFIVGDAKQSIYAFRGAEVDVYQGSRTVILDANRAHGREHDPLPTTDDEGEYPETPEERLGEIRLDRNFRSLPNVVHFTNALFDTILAPEDGLRRLDEAEPGALHPNRPPLANSPGDVTILPAPHRLADLVDTGRLTADAAERIDLGTYTATQLVQHLVQRIERGGLLVYDETEETERAARYADVAILIPARTRLGALARALRAHGVPYVVSGGRGFWGRPEVWDLVNVLAFLADRTRGIELLGILRSPLFGWTDDAITRVVTSDESGYMAKIRAAAASPELLGPTASMCATNAAATYERLTRWRALAAGGTVGALVETILGDSGYEAAFVDDPDAARIIANVQRFVDIVRTEERRRALPLGALVRLLEHLITSEADEGEAPPERIDDNAVSIMTIHAAKGLEFPIVYVTELGARRGSGNRGASLQRGALDGHEILACKIVGQDGERLEPVLHTLLAKGCKRRERAEARRLLYVALTRARDHLVLHGTTKRLIDAKGDAGPARGPRDAKDWMEHIEHALGIDADTYGDAWGAEPLERSIGGATYTIEPFVPDLHAYPQAATQVPSVHEPPRLKAAADAAPLAPLVIAPSDLETQRLCHARFRYRVIEGLPERALRGVQARPLERGSVFGSLVHRALAEQDNGDLSEAALEAVVAGYAERLGVDPERFAAPIRDHVARARSVMPRRSNTLHELSFDVALAPMVRIRGTLDDVEPGADGKTWVVTDHKTDTLAHDDDATANAHAAKSGYDEQVRLYAHAIGTGTRARILYTGTGRLVDIAPSHVVDDLVQRVMHDRALRREPPGGAAGDDDDQDAALDALWPRDPDDIGTCTTCPYLARHGGPCAGAIDPAA